MSAEIEFEHSSFYTDLDSLFDMRLVTLYQLGVNVAEEAVSGGYFNRVVDEFEGIDTETFEKAYAARDADTLKQAMVTKVIDLIQIFIKHTMVALVNSPYRRQPRIVVNTHPYDLSEQMEKSIILGLVAATRNMADVELISLPMEMVTPSYVKENFAQMAMYHYNTWLDIHSENKNFADTQCPTVTLFGPGLFRSKEAMKNMGETDVFEVLEAYAAIFVKLSIIQPRIFSVDYDRLKRKAA